MEDEDPVTYVVTKVEKNPCREIVSYGIEHRASA